MARFSAKIEYREISNCSYISLICLKDQVQELSFLIELSSISQWDTPWQQKNLRFTILVCKPYTSCTILYRHQTKACHKRQLSLDITKLTPILGILTHNKYIKCINKSINLMTNFFLFFKYWCFYISFTGKMIANTKNLIHSLKELKLGANQIQDGSWMETQWWPKSKWNSNSNWAQNQLKLAHKLVQKVAGPPWTNSSIHWGYHAVHKNSGHAILIVVHGGLVLGCAFVCNWVVDRGT